MGPQRLLRRCLSVASSSSSAGTTSLTRPRARASDAPMTLPVRAIAFALWIPIRWRSNHEVPKSRLRPRLAKIAENRARSEHQIMSAARAKPSPAPTHTPSTLATIGTGQSCTASTTSAKTLIPSMMWPEERPEPLPSLPVRSAPAQNSPPAPVRTMSPRTRVGEIAEGGAEGDPHVPRARVLRFRPVDEYRRDVPLRPHSDIRVV